MDQEILNSLKEAAGLIKEKKLKSARGILVDLLREDPEIDQAWYMLSFTVPVIDRQIYALEQALKVNPHNEKALARLQKLRGESKPVKDAFSFKKTKQEREEDYSYPADESDAGESGADLLSRRLLGEDDESAAVPPEPEASPPIQEPETVQAVAAPEESNIEPEAPLEKPKKKEKKEKYSKKVFGISRGLFILIILILIFSGLGILGYSQEIKEFIAGFQGTPTQDTSVAQDDGEDVGQIEATPTPEQTATSGIDLPPVWTPTPTTPAEPTEEPQGLPVNLSQEIINFDVLTGPDSDTITEFEQIAAQLGTMMDDVEIPVVEAYLLSEEDVIGVLSEFARSSAYRNQVNQLGLFLQGLGLAVDADENESIIQNMWADSNGTLLFHDTGKAIIADFNISQYQRYSYAKVLVQNYRNTQNSFADLGIFPMCSPMQQACDVLFGLTKGEAAFFAGEWAAEYMGTEAFGEFSTTEVNRFVIFEDDPRPFTENYLALPDSFGKDFVEQVFEYGGLAAVENAYLSPPQTTEQLLHPEKYLENEEAISFNPVEISVPLGVSWQQVYAGPLGEWKTYLLLADQVNLSTTLQADQARTAAAGWGGDYAQIYYRNSTQEFVVVSEWVWDTPTDAAEFKTALSQMILNKTGAATLILESGGSCTQSSESIDCVLDLGERIVWIQGPGEETVNLLYALFID